MRHNCQNIENNQNYIKGCVFKDRGENRVHEPEDITVERDCLKERQRQKKRRTLTADSTDGVLLSDSCDKMN